MDVLALARLRIARKIPLTTKQVNKGFYKGTGSGSMGWHTKHGAYRIDWAKVRTYIVPPALAKFKVRANDSSSSSSRASKQSTQSKQAKKKEEEQHMAEPCADAEFSSSRRLLPRG